MSKEIDYGSANDLSTEIANLVSANETVLIKNVTDMKVALSVVRTALNRSKLKYRVKTSKRAGLAAAATASGVAGWLVAPGIISASMSTTALAGASAFVIAAPIVGIAGLGASVGIAAHRLATRNPDYEVIKYPLSKEVEIIFQR